MTTKKLRATTDGVAFEVEVDIDRASSAPVTVRVREAVGGERDAASSSPNSASPAGEAVRREPADAARRAAPGAAREATAEAARDVAASFLVSSDDVADAHDRVRIVPLPIPTAATGEEHAPPPQPAAAAGPPTPTRVTGGTSAASARGRDDSARAHREARTPGQTLAPVAAAADARGSRTTRAVVVPQESTTWVFVEGEVWTIDVESSERTAARRPRAAAGAEGLMAPMPATVIRVLVEPGREVRRGETLLLLEAMKMELPVRAPRDGRVTAIRCEAGQIVQPGVALVELA